MDFSLELVQELSPDQASLNAAKKLLNPKKWPLRGKNASVNTIWGQCQGSGANPYYTMADVADHGYKCTCPSRKFPCKHVLALLWQFSEQDSDFTEGSPPDWVNEWLGRRRKSAPSSTVTSTKDNAENSRIKSSLKNIHNAETKTEPKLTADEQAKKQEQSNKRAEQNKAKTDASITLCLHEFQSWIDDQLRTGIAGFLKDINSRCRRISTRLVDAKASALASRVDELPAKVLCLPAEQQAHQIFKELGQLVLLSNAWLANCNDADTRAAIIASENKETVLAQHHISNRSSTWEKVGERIHTRRDGLIRHESWLIRIDQNHTDSKTSTLDNTKEPSPEFALLLDHYPASAGKRKASFHTNSYIEGNITYYPSRQPLRAFFTEHTIVKRTQNTHWPLTKKHIFTNYQEQLVRIPWLEYVPHILGGGRIAEQSKGNYWWTNHIEDIALPLSNTHISELLLGSELTAICVLWDGSQAELLSAQTVHWGKISC